LEHADISQAQFEDGNKVGFDLHFGCNILVQESDSQDSELDSLLDFFKGLS
jgi:hypothetical protein